MRVAIAAFAGLRELLAGTAADLELPAGASVADAWSALERRQPALAPLAVSTRLARNGRLAATTDLLSDGDELALLPPVGGG
ncbi:MAG TPA: MoaD/ThiS family protein [Candidatus Acidoferrales bacterium]|jgi:molybdopterin converting factor small subunit|nr:MoaD/ThiS family protein [Candidatus Acidoferrales bacterium]